MRKRATSLISKDIDKHKFLCLKNFKCEIGLKAYWHLGIFVQWCELRGLMASTKETCWHQHQHNINRAKHSPRQSPSPTSHHAIDSQPNVDHQWKNPSTQATYWGKPPARSQLPEQWVGWHRAVVKVVQPWREYLSKFSGEQTYEDQSVPTGIQVEVQYKKKGKKRHQKKNMHNKGGKKVEEGRMRQTLSKQVCRVSTVQSFTWPRVSPSCTILHLACAHLCPPLLPSAVTLSGVFTKCFGCSWISENRSNSHPNCCKLAVCYQ